MPHQGESRVTFHLSTQAAETKHPREGRPHNAGTTRRVGMPRREHPLLETAPCARRPPLRSMINGRQTSTCALDVGLALLFGADKTRSTHSPSTWNPTERIKSPTAHFQISRTAIATVRVSSWELSEHVIATAGPGPCEVRMSPKVKKMAEICGCEGPVRLSV